MAASIREVALEAKVSLSTVSKVLNATPNAKFSAATKERVFSAAHRIGYHPNAVARGLARQRMDAIGAVMAYSEPSVTTDFYLGAALDGILQVNKRNGQKTVLFTEDSWEDAFRHLPAYCDGHCDGLLLIIPRIGSEIVHALEARGDVPFVLIGDSSGSDTLCTVDMDNVAAAHEAVSYLISLGHKRIAAFCGNTDFHSNEQRLAGYHAALTEAGIALDDELVFVGEYWPQHGHDNAYALYSRFPDAAKRPTAIFCFNDSIARGTCDAILEMNVRIPDDISIISIDDSAHAVSRRPYLTTMSQDIRGIGARATEILLARIKEETKTAVKWLAPVKLVTRETTGTLPAPPSNKSASPQPIPKFGEAPDSPR